MASDVMVICKKCGNKSPSSTMKLDLDEGLMICPDCVKNKKISKEIKETILNKPSSLSVKSTFQEERPLKSMHKCNYCSYKFPINLETRKPKHCPYCSKEILALNLG